MGEGWGEGLGAGSWGSAEDSGLPPWTQDASPPFRSKPSATEAEDRGRGTPLP